MFFSQRYHRRHWSWYSSYSSASWFARLLSSHPLWHGQSRISHQCNWSWSSSCSATIRLAERYSLKQESWCCTLFAWYLGGLTEGSRFSSHYFWRRRRTAGLWCSSYDCETPERPRVALQSTAPQGCSSGSSSSSLSSALCTSDHWHSKWTAAIDCDLPSNWALQSDRTFSWLTGWWTIPSWTTEPRSNYCRMGSNLGIRRSGCSRCKLTCAAEQSHSFQHCSLDRIFAACWSKLCSWPT